MALFTEKIKSFFTKQPLPSAAFQISPSYLSGIHVSPREGKTKNHFLFSLDRGMIQPSFSEKNIKNPALLEKRIKEGREKLRLSDHKIACLIPELSLRAFVFSFDSLPPSRPEREQIIRYRIKKQMPLIPEDARFSFNILSSNDTKKVLAAVAKGSVIQEYEDIFHKLHLKVRAVSSPTLSLYNLVVREKEKDFLIINIEEDSLSLMAVVNSEIALYRMKPFVLGSRTDASQTQRIKDIVKELENTVNFVEDKEKIKVNSFWVRIGLMEAGEKMMVQLREKLPFPLQGIESCLDLQLGLKEEMFLSPLIGQTLC